MRPIILATAAALALAGCATSPDQITPSSVSPALYSGQSCAALNTEAHRINSRLAAVTGAQQSRASRDTAMTATAVILFWPAAFFIGAGQDHAAEIAQLRGEAEALAHAARARGC